MTRTFPTRFFVVALVLTLFVATGAFAQVNLNALDATYNQPFDSLPTSNGTWTNNTTLAGWYAQTQSNGTPATLNAGTGSGNAGGIWSFGIAATNPVTERALGSLASNTTNAVYFGILFTNNTGATITSLDVSFDAEQWRNGGNATAQTLAFSYKTGTLTGVLADFNTGGTNVTALDFLSPVATVTAAAVDGNAPANRAAKSTTITGLSVANGQQILLRWTDANDTGNDHAMAVDGLNVTPHGAPPVPALNISNPILAEGNAGTTTFTFAVTLTTPAGPGGVTFDIATADGTAQDDTPATEDNDYVAKSLTGQNIPMGSTGPYNFTVDVNGDATVEANETFVVNVSNITGASNPGGTAQGTGTINNDDATLPFININDVTMAEGNGGPTVFTFNVTLSAPAPPGGVTFDIATADGTAQDDTPATEDNDYVQQSLTGQNIPMGSTGPYQFNVTVNGDPQFEPNETFFVNITSVTGATTTTPGDTQGQGNINNDDNGLNVSDVTAAETNAGTTTFTFNVTLTNPAPPGGVTFDIATADGTAQDDNPASEDNDYVAKSLTGQNIPMGSTGPYNFTVDVNGDAAFEANETFFVNVTNIVGASPVDPQGLGTITNDDAAPTLSIADAAITEGQAGTQTLTFTVTLTPAAAGTVTVDYATADSSATVANNDYVAVSTTQLTFNPGDTTKTFDVTINGDTNSEGQEQFFVNLTNANGAVFAGGDSQALGIIRMDDPRGIPAVDTPQLENFDSLVSTGVGVATPGATTPVGWTFRETGANANDLYSADDGGSNAGNTYSFGPDASPDRAFGGVQSGSLIPTVGAFYRNDTAVPITTLTIGYTGEEWRCGATGRADRLDFQYSLDATSLSTGTWTDFDTLDFTSPDTTATGNKNGNAPGFRTAINATITGLNIAPNGTFWIRYNDLNATGAGDDGLAVDDFSITANITGILTINDVSIIEGNAGTQTLTFTVTRSDPAPAGGTTFDIQTADNTALDADNDYEPNAVVGLTIPQGSTTATFDVTINGDVNQEPTETFFANITNVTNAVLIDGQGIGSIIADDFTIVFIHEIQGNGTTSPAPYNGTSRTVSGIVTGIKQGGSGGFFVQEELADYDVDAQSSEGIFVFTAGAIPAGVAIGNRVAVTGTVQEFPAASAPNTVTELSGTVSVSLLATGQPLPPAETLSTPDGAPSANINQYERFEGMRVSTTLTVTAPTAGSKNEAAATGSSDGVFYGVVQGNPLSFREPGIPAGDIVPAEASCPACIPRFDRNPQKLRVDSDNQPGATQLNVVVGQTVSNLTGPLDFGFNEYTILPEAATVPIATGSSTFIAVPAPLASELTVAGFNLERFYDDVADGAGDTQLSTSGYNNRLAKASLAVRNVLRNPDVIGVVEVEKLSVLQALATKINSDSGGAVSYVAYLEEGNDPGAIDVGFLVNSLRVNGVVVTQIDKTLQYIDTNGVQDELHDRPPLMLEATIQRTDATPYAFTVIVSHLRSLISNEQDSATGRRVRDKRARQAEHLANLIQSRQTANPNERIIAVGDFNAFQFSDGMVDLIDTVKGTPPPANEVVRPSADLVNPNLTNLIDLNPAADRYSYSFDGNLQVIDHAIVTPAFLTTFKSISIAHLDAGFPEIFRTDASRPERVSDHDAVVSYFDLTPAGAFSFSASNYNVSESTTTFNVTVNRTGGSAGAVSVSYAVAAGTANPADFTAATGTLNFAAGETSKTFAVTIANDAIDEADQTIALSLNTPTGGATLGSPNTATITIQDDDAPPVFTIGDVSHAEGNSGVTNAQLTVTLTGASELTSNVTWTTTDGTATAAGSDYTTSSNTLTFNGPGSQTIDIPILGDATDEPNETVNVNLSGNTNASIGDPQGVVTIVNDDGAPQLFINDLAVTEGNSGTSQATLTVTLVGSTSQPVDVSWTLTAGTASCCGVDFSGPDGTMTFQPGQTTKSITVTIFGELIHELNETVFVNLYNAVNATIADTQGVITINNDDAPPVFTINDNSAAEGNSGSSNGTLTVTKTGATELAATVDYATANGTATAGSDYTATNGTLTFAAGTTTQTINVSMTGDTVNEANETVLVNLTNATNATIGDTQGVLTINNDDGAPTLAINDMTLAEGNAGTTNFVFTVTLTGTTAQTVTVDYATANGTATAGSDYTANTGTLTFAPGVLTQQVTVAVTGETAIETNETFFVNLTNAGNATITDNQGLGTITNDDAAATADLTITQQISPANPQGGQNVTITITVTNNGPADATNVVVTDNTPAGMTFVSSSASQGSCSGNPTVTCSLGTILNGANAAVTIVMTAPAAGGVFNNGVSATANESDPTPVINSQNPIVILPAAETDPKIPTLSEWGLLALALALAALAATRLRA